MKPGDSQKKGQTSIIRPSRKLRQLYHLYLLLVVWFLVIPGLVLLIFFIPPVTRFVISISVLAIALLSIFWLRKYYESLSYTMGIDNVTFERGVILKRTTCIPYIQIITVETVRPRLAGYLGISSLKVRYSPTSTSSLEIQINGIEDPEALRSLILEHVSNTKIEGQS
jgi:membrane protein YdbS with pleckstrin-like domain